MSSKSDILLDESRLDDLLEKWTRDVVGKTRDIADLAVVGIRTRGVPLARRLHSALENETGREIPSGILDITLYRDDLQSAGSPVIQGTEIMFDIQDRTILLVDDVLFTGRTIRAGMNEIFDFGRPAAVRLAVLVDRGGRELPICSDFTGKSLSVPSNQMVRLRLREIDGEHAVITEPRQNES